MIANLSSWAQGIIVAIIIGSIIQMLLPENKNKKYIRMVLGVYILFCIISPVVGKQLNLDEYNLEKYIDVENKNIQEETNIYDKNIRDIFKNKVILNIKSQLNSKGYESNNIQIDIDENCNILKIKISEIYERQEDTEINENNQIVINKIETGINEVSIDIKEKRVSGIATSDKNSLIDYLVENYQIDRKNIIIE